MATSSRRSLTTLALTCAVSFALAGCGGADDQDAATAPASSLSVSPSVVEPAETNEGSADQKPSAEPDVVVPDALDFEATTVGGDAFEGASVAGRPVVLWFWAPWCAVCRSQVPTVTDLAETYGDDVAFIGVGGLDSSDAIEDFADDVPGLTHLSDPDGELYQRFGIAEQSSFVVLDAAGAESLRTGYSDDDALAGVVADLAG